MRTILITGASGGLAQEMVKLLPEDRLILLGRNQEKLEKLYASHPQAECIGIDITDSSAVQDLVEELYQRYGQIDILVNNAGYGIFEAFDRISDQQVQEMFEVNTFALMQFSRLMGAHMKEAGKGHIVNIVSMAGLVATAKSRRKLCESCGSLHFGTGLCSQENCQKLWKTKTRTQSALALEPDPQALYPFPSHLRQASQ